MARKVFIMQRNNANTGWVTRVLEGQNTFLSTGNDGSIEVGGNNRTYTLATASYVGTFGAGEQADITLDLTDSSLFLVHTTSSGIHHYNVQLVTGSGLEGSSRLSMWWSTNTTSSAGNEYYLYFATRSFDRPSGQYSRSGSAVLTNGTGWIFKPNVIHTTDNSSSFIEFIKNPVSKRYRLANYPPDSIYYGTIVGPAIG